MKNDNEESKWIEWNINKYKDIYKGLKIEKKEYDLSAGHSHCELCWHKFWTGADDYKIGYYIEDKDSWICCKCYKTYKDFFEWEEQVNE